jgi:hypothetical protein
VPRNTALQPLQRGFSLLADPLIPPAKDVAYELMCSHSIGTEYIYSCSTVVNAADVFMLLK